MGIERQEKLVIRYSTSGVDAFSRFFAKLQSAPRHNQPAPFLDHAARQLRLFMRYCSAIHEKVSYWPAQPTPAKPTHDAHDTLAGKLPARKLYILQKPPDQQRATVRIERPAKSWVKIENYTEVDWPFSGNRK